jgi:hypothetical protein
MKRRILSSFAVLSLFVMMGAISTQAQVLLRLHANIPFDFVFNGKSMPKGMYLVEENPTIEGAVQISDSQGRVLAIALSQTISNGSVARGDRLVFHQYENLYFLSQVWSTQDGHQLSSSRMERKLLAETSNPITVVIAAQTK